MNVFSAHVYLTNETVFPDNCDDWTNENVSFGAQNYEFLFQIQSPLQDFHNNDNNNNNNNNPRERLRGCGNLKGLKLYQ